MEAFISRLFGRGKQAETSPSLPSRALVVEAPLGSHEQMYMSRNRLEAITSAYMLLLGKEETKMRMYKEKKLYPLAKKHFVRYKRIVKALEKHTDHVICIDNIIDIVRSVEAADATLSEMQAAVDVFRKNANLVNYDKADEIRSELDRRHKELISVQSIILKDHSGHLVLNDAELNAEMDAYFDEDDDDEEEEGKSEDDAEVDASGFVSVPLNSTGVRQAALA